MNLDRFAIDHAASVLKEQPTVQNPGVAKLAEQASAGAEPVRERVDAIGGDGSKRLAEQYGLFAGLATGILGILLAAAYAFLPTSACTPKNAAKKRFVAN